MGAFQRWRLISQRIFLVRGLFDGGFSKVDAYFTKDIFG